MSISSRLKRRYVVIRCTKCEEAESAIAAVAEIIERAFGVVGLSHVDPRLVDSWGGSLYIISVSREGVDKLLASLVLAKDRPFEVVKITGTLRKARRIASSLAGDRRISQ